MTLGCCSERIVNPLGSTYVCEFRGSIRLRVSDLLMQSNNHTLVRAWLALQPMHYTIGACAGLQMSSRESLSIHRKVLQKSLAPVKYGLMATAVGAGVVALGIAVPVVTVGAVGAAGVVVTAAAVGLPVYGGYRVAKYTRERRAAKLREAERREREAAEARRTFWLQEAEDAPEWECTACTFLNPPRTGACDVCTTARPTPVES